MDKALLLDNIIAFVYVISMFGVAMYLGRKKIDGTNGYFLGNSSFSSTLIALTVVATFLGAASTVGATGKAIKEGVSSMWYLMAQAGAFIALAYYMVPRIYPLKVLTVAEFFEIRYDKNLRKIAGIILGISTFAIMPAQIIAGAKVISNLTGIGYQFAFWGIGTLLVLYTTLGGLPAVIYSDALQAILIAVGFIVALPIVLTAGGGFSNLYAQLPDAMQNWTVGQSGNWDPQIMGAWFLTVVIGRFGSQTWFQRAKAAKSAKDAKRGFLYGGLIGMVFGPITMMLGIAAYVLIPGIEGGDALPQLYMNFLPAGIRAVAMGSIIAAIMSSGDSFVNSVSALVVNDIYTPMVQNKSDKHYLKVAQITTFALGIGAMLLATISTDILKWINVGFLIKTSGAYLMVFGIYWKKANAKGAYAALISGASVAIIWKYFITSSLNVFWPSSIAVIISMVVVSIATGGPRDEQIEFFKEYEAI